MGIVYQDVLNLLNASLAYTAGIALCVCFAAVVYLTIDLLIEFVGGK